MSILRHFSHRASHAAWLLGPKQGISCSFRSLSCFSCTRPFDSESLSGQFARKRLLGYNSKSSSSISNPCGPSHVLGTVNFAQERQTLARAASANRTAEAAMSTAAGADMDTAANEVLAFWFEGLDIESGSIPAQRWFMGGKEQDDLIKSKFSALVEEALAGQLDQWKASIRGRLALVIVLDQFTRTVFRDSGKAFAGDVAAQALVREAVDKGLDGSLGPFERVFLYMPLMHAESLEVHTEVAEPAFARLCSEVETTPSLHKHLSGFLKFEMSHKVVIERFGRYPTRNEALGRSNTPAEEEYLAEVKAGKSPF